MTACPYCGVEPPVARVPAEGSVLCACDGCLNPYVMTRDEDSVQSRTMPRMRDVRTLAAEGSIGAELFKGMDKAVESLPVLPELSQRIIEMMDDPDVAMPAVADVVRSEQVIAVRVMRMANSAVYGGLQEIKDLDAACGRLGMKLVANAAQTAVSRNLFATSSQPLKDYMKALWRHSVATAHTANELARLLSMPRLERMFLAGLVHDIGKLSIIQLISTAKSGPLAGLRDSPELCSEVIENFHMLVGLLIVQRWDLPPEFSITTFCHHDPSLCPDPVHVATANVVCLADAIARAEGYTTALTDEPVYLMALPSSLYLNMTDIRLASLRVDLADKVEVLMEDT